MSEEHPKGLSLSTLVTLHCAWIIALFMWLYAMVEMALFHETILYAALKHTYHVIVLTGGLLLVLRGVIRFYVDRPIAQINAQLYRLGAGDAKLPPVQSRIREIQDIVRGIEKMRERMRLGEPGAAHELAEQAFENLRGAARAIHEKFPAESETILDAVVSLGESCVGHSHVDYEPAP